MKASAAQVSAAETLVKNHRIKVNGERSGLAFFQNYKVEEARDCGDFVMLDYSTKSFEEVGAVIVGSRVRYVIDLSAQTVKEVSLE